MAGVWNATLTVNVPAVVFVFLLFLLGQTLLLTTLMDPPCAAESREVNLLWISTALHAVLALLLTVLVFGLAATFLPCHARALLWTLLVVGGTILLWDFVAYQLMHEHVFDALRLFWENVFLDQQIMRTRKLPLLLILVGYAVALASGTALFAAKEARWKLLRWVGGRRSGIGFDGGLDGGLCGLRILIALLF